jgi:hypothetical protein
MEYLKAQNRPFSATEVSANLHGKVCCSLSWYLGHDLGCRGYVFFSLGDEKILLTWQLCRSRRQ